MIETDKKLRYVEKFLRYCNISKGMALDTTIKQYSDDIYERYWVNQCLDKLKEIDKFNDEYCSRLEKEADINEDGDIEEVTETAETEEVIEKEGEEDEETVV